MRCSTPDLLDRADHQGHSVAQHRDDLRRERLPGGQSSTPETCQEHHGQPFQHVEPDLNVPVLALQIADSQAADGAVVPFLPDIQPPHQQRTAGGEREQGKGVGEIADKVRNARGENDDGREIPYGGRSLPPVEERARMTAKKVHVYRRSTSMVLSRTNTMGRSISRAEMLFRQEEMRKHHGAEQDQAEPLFPLGELGDPDGQQCCMMPVPALRLLNSSMTMRITSTS